MLTTPFSVQFSARQSPSCAILVWRQQQIYKACQVTYIHRVEKGLNVSSKYQNLSLCEVEIYHLTCQQAGEQRQPLLCEILVCVVPVVYARCRFWWQQYFSIWQTLWQAINCHRSRAESYHFYNYALFRNSLGWKETYHSTISSRYQLL